MMVDNGMTYLSFIFHVIHPEACVFVGNLALVHFPLVVLRLSELSEIQGFHFMVSRCFHQNNIAGCYFITDNLKH